jgi:hypothetical protein
MDAGQLELDELRGSPVVTLEWYEVALASRVGLSRQLNALSHGKAEADGRGGEPGWNHHIEGALGELAAAKFLGLYWGGPINTYKIGGDVGTRIQVRTRSECWYGLKIKGSDRNDDIFVLCLGRCPIYHVRGWVYAGDVRAYLDKNPAAKATWVIDPAGRGCPNIFVPQSALRPVYELIESAFDPVRGLAPEPPGGYRPSVRKVDCPVCKQLHADLQSACRGAR